MQHRPIAVLLMLLAGSSVLIPQHFSFQPNRFGANLFFGGTATPRFQFVDIDGDLDRDLFIFDRDERLWFFRNDNGAYRCEPEYTLNIPVVYWFSFVDIDADGDVDCFTSNSSVGTDFYRNTGTPQQPNFILDRQNIADTVHNSPVFVEPLCVPAFADIDGDGDLDFFAGSSSGSITFYRNTGTASSFHFLFVTSQFQDIVINSGPAGFGKRLHGSSAIEFFDADSNGTLDLFWGDLFNRSMYYLKNSGTRFVPSIALRDSSFPKPDTIVTLGMNMPQHVDVDNDGRYDLLSASLYGNSTEPDFWYYRNEGSNAAPVYARVTKNFLPMIDAGSRSTVAPADVDGDGDIDLILSSAAGTIAVYRNSGSTTQPVYAAEPDFTLSQPGKFYGVVTAGDLSGDGKPDIVVGNFDGSLSVYVNTSAGEGISFILQSHPLSSITAGQNAAPHLFDPDGNGVLDLLVGSNTGRLMLVKNTGTTSVPQYTVTPSLNSIDVGNDAIPFTGDLDGDGILDLLIGNTEGVIHHYRAVPSSADSFELVTKKFLQIDQRSQSAPAMADMDGDGDRDLLIGTGRGGVLYYEQSGSTPVRNSERSVPQSTMLLQNYPNPFNPSTTIPFFMAEEAHVTVSVHDLLGREIMTILNDRQRSGAHAIRWSATNLASGTYFYTLRIDNGKTVQQFTKVLSLIK